MNSDIKTNAELLERAQELKVSSLAELESKDDTEVLVIDFMSTVVWVDEDVLTETVVNGRIVGTTETKKVQKTAITVIYSCKLIILWILALHALGFVFDLQADGTYRYVHSLLIARSMAACDHVFAPTLLRSRRTPGL